MWRSLVVPCTAWCLQLRRSEGRRQSSCVAATDDAGAKQRMTVWLRADPSRSGDAAIIWQQGRCQEPVATAVRLNLPKQQWDVGHECVVPTKVRAPRCFCEVRRALALRPAALCGTAPLRRARRAEFRQGSEARQPRARGLRSLCRRARSCVGPLCARAARLRVRHGWRAGRFARLSVVLAPWNGCRFRCRLTPLCSRRRSAQRRFLAARAVTQGVQRALLWPKARRSLFWGARTLAAGSGRLGTRARGAL